MHAKHYLFLSLLTTQLLYPAPQTTPQSEKYYHKSLEELLATETELKADIGSRSGERDTMRSDTPIDVITTQQIHLSGSLELSEILQKYIAGFNYPSASIKDGTDHSKPFTLRGLNPDQVLVLINGKRLHQSSLIHVNNTIGRGSSSVDLNTIPIASIERIEVLRDGAAAQYGSDAIAGVINVILKGYGHKNRISTTYAQTHEGDGKTKQTDLFYSTPLPYDGFINITAEFRDNQKTNRAGPDLRDLYPQGDPRNDLIDPITMHYGDPEAQNILLALNSEIISKNGTTFYAHGIFNKRESHAGAIFRLPTDDRNNLTLYPDGFLPHIAPKILDYSLSLGIKDRLQNGIKWDLSYTNGYNNFHFYVHNSLNDSLGDSSPTSFDSGGTSYLQQVINLDLSKNLELLTLAGGIEYRKEHYTIYKGEPDSYRLGEFSTNVGAQGFPGFLPSNEVDAHRENVGLYIDAKFNPHPNLTLEVASRFEHYSDFGNTFDGKFSALYKPTPSLMFRGSLNTGFRAPSLSQSYFTSTTTEYVVNGLNQVGSFAVNNPVARDLGAVELKPEISQHYTFGFIYQPSSNLSLSADYFYSAIDDRILLTGNISGSISPQVQAILDSYNVTKARYFTNAIGTQTDGVDVRLNYHHRFESNLLLKTNLAYHYNSTQITQINTAPSILGEAGEGILIDRLTQERIVSGQPKHILSLYTQLTQGDYALGFNLKRFGEYASVLGEDLYRFDAKWVSDVEFSYQINPTFNLSIGAKNLFDVYPDTWGDTGSDFYSTQGSFPYPPESPFGYNGRSYHIRIEGRF